MLHKVFVYVRGVWDSSLHIYNVFMQATCNMHIYSAVEHDYEDDYD